MRENKMNEKENVMMSIERIREQYQDEWVLIEYKNLDENLNVKEGKVIAHSPNKREIYNLLAKTKGKNIAIEYTGKIPEDLTVMYKQQ